MTESPQTEQELRTHIYAAAGKCPAPFPEEWTPDACHQWAVECQLGYQGFGRFLLTRAAMRLWLVAGGYTPGEANAILSHVREFP